MIDDEIDSSVELTEISPSDKFRSNSPPTIGKRKRDSKREEVKSVLSMGKTKKQKVTNNNKSAKCPSLSRLDEASVVPTQEIEKGELCEEEVRDALFYFKSDR